MKLLTVIGLSFALGFFSSQIFLMFKKSKQTDIVLKTEETLNIMLPIEGFFLEVKNNTDDVTIGFVSYDKAQVGNRIMDGGRIETYFWSENSQERTTITDSDSDGIPDYRLIKGSRTGRVSKEYPNVTWSETKIDQANIP